jgi:hypothetical protein
MPYTPLHMGPGLIAKAIAPKHVSIIAFGVTQVLIDLEVLWNMGHHNPQLHTFFHTYVGASLVVIVAISVAKPLSTLARRSWNLLTYHASHLNVAASDRTTWTATIAGACIGAYSHVLFDSFYHLDIQPFQPWSAANPFKGLLTPAHMELAFLVMFMLAIVWLTIRAIRKRGLPETSQE